MVLEEGESSRNLIDVRAGKIIYQVKPLRLLILTVLFSLAAELIGILFIANLPPKNQITVFLLDAAVPSLFLIPILYFFLYRPIKDYQDALLKTYQALLQSQAELEGRVQERTNDLSRINENLLAEIANRKQAEVEKERKNRELQLLFTNAASLGQSLKLADRISAVQHFLTNQLGARAGFISIRPSEQEPFFRETSWGETPEGFRLNEQHERIVQTLEPVFCPFSLGSSQTNNIENSGTYAGFPLVWKDKLFGFLEFFLEGSQYSSDEQNSFLITLANQICSALYNSYLYESEIGAREMAETLLDSSMTFSHNFDVDQLVDQFLNRVEKNIPTDGAILLLADDSKSFKVSGLRGTLFESSDRETPQASINVEDYPAFQHVLTSQKPDLIDDIAKATEWKPFFGGLMSGAWLGIPIFGSEEVIGICVLANRTPGAITRQQMVLTEALASQAGMAINSAWLFNQAKDGRERLRLLTKKLVEGQEKERRYISRELHDQTSQALVYLKIVLELLRGEANDPSRVADRVVELNHITEDIIDDLHRLAADLRPGTLDLFGLVPALQEYVQNFNHKQGLEIHLICFDLDRRFSPDLEVHLFRLVQEALTNIIRHAKASNADIMLTAGQDKITARVADDGIGFSWDEAIQKGHLGLLGMRERVEMMGGTFRVDSTPDYGTQINIEVPYAR